MWVLRAQALETHAISIGLHAGELAPIGFVIGYEFDGNTGQFEPVSFPLFLPIIGIRGQF